MNSLERKEAQKVKNIARATINYLLKFPNTSRSKITNLKGKFAKKFSYDRVIKNATVLSFATEQEKLVITKILKRRTTRTISGVSVIAIMTKPLECPGKCVYCPGKESQPGEPVAQSYTGREPAAMRSIHNNYDSFQQVRSRIEDLEAIGHKVDKIELIIMGGTFLSADNAYQTLFIKGALEGIIGKRTKNLREAIKTAEKSKRRIIGLTIETRPDHCKEPHVDTMLNYGTTRVEIGIQTVYDEIYNLVNRGHTTEDSIEAIRIARDAGLKINAHMMPNLPGSNIERDLETFNILFSDPNYKPDMIKIYPCLVIKGTELYNWWKEGKFSPYSDEDLINLIANVKQTIPPYVRIQRIMRDIPAYLIEAGCKKSNLRQLILEKLEKDGAQCKCIRCREYGIANRRHSIDDDTLDEVKLYRMDYEASQGNEIFLSFENKKEKYLVGYLRLRKPSKFAHRPELNDGNTMIVREIKVVGELVPTDLKPRRMSQIQHRGYGTLLMDKAEKISSEEFDANKLAVISGIGVRDWFYSLGGYKLDGPYVSKFI
ncbi:MAG: tRNA uridine(34) 5-carboxymethylaminomethyl modification radical SAM/GNAT enzyme Elp3 [Candidatus Lokiarchaeota archaeon]|nr:tRNA uridine(34) 5-carboxymethylaminomethyl modification radical SAM/GNAT enzyme Elp3 [Candidatus Lokiarchaeota archaeon]MBD3339401.1 tRNA uridine(34) 5-carboxymethylaminomethyl modification radical SAM/GNAT enzyme Elp3 [Candidatus Lokiarchaeota archaeon]